MQIATKHCEICGAELKHCKHYILLPFGSSRIASCNNSQDIITLAMTSDNQKSQQPLTWPEFKRNLERELSGLEFKDEKSRNIVIDALSDDLFEETGDYKRRRKGGKGFFLQHQVSFGLFILATQTMSYTKKKPGMSYNENDRSKIKINSIAEKLEYELDESGWQRTKEAYEKNILKGFRRAKNKGYIRLLEDCHILRLNSGNQYKAEILEDGLILSELFRDMKVEEILNLLKWESRQKQ